ncbi:hypothetical protein PAMP_013409 [Pampus punctatissimus]
MNPRMRTYAAIHLQGSRSLVSCEKPAGGSWLALAAPVVKAPTVCDFSSLRLDVDSSDRLFHFGLWPFGFLCFAGSDGHSTAY